MITREQIEKIAAQCGVKVSYVEKGKGGFIIDSTNVKYNSVTENIMEQFGVQNKNKQKYSISDENIFFAA